MTYLEIFKVKVSGINIAATALLCLIAFCVGVASGASLTSAILLTLLVSGAIFCLLYFDYFILTLLILRSTMDTFYAIQLPSVFAISLDIIAILYIVLKMLGREPIRVDRFFFVFAAWCLFQSLWVVLIALGGLGADSYLLGDSIREIIRLGSWFLVYTLILLRQGNMRPQKFISLLFLSLVIPLFVALLQMIVPGSLPPELSPLTMSLQEPGLESVAIRIRGTIGHPNGFATFLFFFICLAYWKFLENRNQRLIWMGLIIILGLFYVTTNSLFSLGMLAIFLIGTATRNITFQKLFFGIVLFGTIIILFGSSPAGQERLASISNTPLINTDIDISRAIIMSNSDNNSFNWRISQWTDYLTRWEKHPWLGYGIGVSTSLAANNLEPHNDYVRWLFEQGIVGFTGVLLFFAAQFHYLAKRLKSDLLSSSQKNLCHMMIIMLVALLFGMVTENIWDHTMLFFYWWTLFAVIGWDWREPVCIDKEM